MRYREGDRVVDAHHYLGNWNALVEWLAWFEAVPILGMWRDESGLVYLGDDGATLAVGDYLVCDDGEGGFHPWSAPTFEATHQLIDD